MLITKVDLENTKSYTDQTVTFTPGVNAICGQNGAGKSTILEAVGFVLFDTLPYTQADFVRDGEKTATAAVSFVSNLDEREYQVVRKCGSSYDYYVYDPDSGYRLVEGKADVIDWLKEHLGIDETADLSSLFEDAVGVPQGLLTSAFMQTPARRKPIFDPLLQVDEYERVWHRLRDTESYLEKRRQELETQIAGLRATVERLPVVHEEHTELKKKVKSNEERVAAVQERLETVAAEKAALDTARDQLEALERQLESITQKIAALEERKEDAEADVQKAEQARQAVEETQAGHERYVEAQETIEELEEKRLERDQLQRQITACEQEIALLEQRIEGLEEDLETIAEAEAAMEALAPKVEQQKTLEDQIEQVEDDVRMFENAQARLEEEEEELEDLRDRLDQIAEQLEERAAYEQERETLRADLDELKTTITRLDARQPAIEKQQQELDQRIEILSDVEEPTCPVCQEPLSEERAAELADEYRHERQALEKEYTSNADTLKDTNEQGDKLEARLAELEVYLGRLPTEAQREDMVQQIETQRKTVQTWQREAAAVKDAPERLKELERELEELGDPRQSYRRHQDTAEKRDGVEAKLAEAKENAAEHRERKATLKDQLAPYGDLDEQLADAREMRQANEEAYNRYLSNVGIAEELDDRRAKVADLAEEIEEGEAEREALDEQVAAAREEYDAQIHEQLEDEHGELTKEQARLEERLRNQRNRLTEIADEIETLEEKEAKLEEAQAEREQQQALLTYVGYIRQTIKDAGPHITRALVQTISLDAARMFSDIMNEYTMHLAWHDDYRITVEQNGRAREFQQLSGGEQMAAALAVRLALLKEMTNVDVAFFDEPTTNLDDTRRDSLAEQITDIRGFSQLFVISHDDTFERATQNVVRVYKEDGESCWEEG